MLKRILKYTKYTLITLLGGLFIILLVMFAKPLWRHFFTYPRYQREVEAFSLRKKECPEVTNLKTFRGELHLHSYWSHDSKGSVLDLVNAAKLRHINFLFLTDHPHGTKDSFPRGYKGMYDGVLIEPGSEMRGFDAWPLDSATVVDWKVDKDTVLRQLVKKGGMVFYAHTEEPHNWSNQWFQGMEIYNFHSNVKEKTTTWPILTDFLINGSKFRAWAYHSIFDRQTSILARWDSLNMHRKIIGFSAVDEHENINVRARYLKDGRVLWSGIDTKPIAKVKVSFLNRWMFHEPDQNGWIFRWMIVNTYETSFNNTVNYVFADTLSVRNISHHLIQGNHFTAFQFLADATGFCYYGENPGGKLSGIIGDSIKLGDISKLKAVSPYPGRFTLVKDGKILEVTSGEDYNFTFDKALQKGAYRLEVEVKPGEEWLPWVYTNPIYIY
jgi:hypothetical protein